MKLGKKKAENSKINHRIPSARKKFWKTVFKLSFEKKYRIRLRNRRIIV
jgi:hypothetical protein